MLNRPFSSTNTNIFDETTRNCTPATVCGQNVLLSQEQHQKVCNTMTTSIAGVPGGPYPYFPQNHSNAVTFTFNPAQQYLPQNWQCPPTMQNLNQLQQANALDLLALQRQLNEPYTCRFHLDNQTSTSDLLKANVVRPDFRNLEGMLKSKWPHWLRTPSRRNHKKLILRNVTAKVEGHVYDDIDEEGSSKKVSFDLGTTKDADCQVELGCTCCQNQNEETTRKSPKRHKKRSRKSGSNSDCSLEDDDQDDDRR